MVKTQKGPANGKLYTDADWNDEAKPDQATCYYLSKVLTAHQSQYRCQVSCCMCSQAGGSV